MDGDVVNLLTGWETVTQFPATRNQNYSRPSSAGNWLARARGQGGPLLVGLYYPGEGSDGFLPSPADIVEDGRQLYLLNERGLIVIEFRVGPIDPVEETAANVVTRYGLHLQPVSMELQQPDFPIAEGSQLHLGFGQAVESVNVADHSQKVWAEMDELGEIVSTLRLGDAEETVTTQTAVFRCRYDEGRAFGYRITDDRGLVWSVTDSQADLERRYIEYRAERNFKLVV